SCRWWPGPPKRRRRRRFDGRSARRIPSPSGRTTAMSLPRPGLRFRRITVWLAFAWAALALFAFLRATLFHTGYTTPFHTSTSARVTITGASEEARAAGVEPGHRLETVDGLPYLQWGREGHWRGLRPEHTNRYGLSTKQGRTFELDLHPVPS